MAIRIESVVHKRETVANTIANSETQVANTDEPYRRYRDKDKRRTYMRELMRRRRQRNKP